MTRRASAIQRCLETAALLSTTPQLYIAPSASAQRYIHRRQSFGGSWAARPASNAMSSATAGTHETAAQRALQIVEVLEIILDYTISPGIDSDDRTVQKAAWESSTICCRAVNKTWKQVFNGVLLSYFNRKGILQSFSTPVSVLKILAGDRMLAAQVAQFDDNTVHMSYAKVLPWCLAILCACDSITTLELGLDTLEAISGIQDACPYMGFPSLTEFAILFSVRFPRPGVSLPRMEAFIKSLPDFFSGTCILEGALDALESPPLSWQVFILARALVRRTEVFLDIQCLRMSEDAASQVACLLEQAQAITGLSLTLEWPLALLSKSIPSSVDYLELDCFPTALPSILEVLADPTHVPHLREIPSLKISEHSAREEEDDFLVTEASIGATVEGLRKRGMQPSEEKVRKLYDLLRPYIRPDEH